jgi:hypothetical protein
MENLPCKIARYLLSFLSIDDRLTLRRVSKTYKTITEYHMKDVKRVSSHRRAVYSPLHAGCRFTDLEICPAASKPECLLVILKYCKSIQCLFIGDETCCDPFGRCYSQSDLQSKEIFGKDEQQREDTMFNKMDNKWTDSQLESAFNFMLEADSLECLSWIGLEVRIPETLRQKLRYQFCPVIHPFHNFTGINGPDTNFIMLIEKELRTSNLHQPDYSDVFQLNGHYVFMERLSTRLGSTHPLFSLTRMWEFNLRCPDGHSSFTIPLFMQPIEVVPISHALNEPHHDLCVSGRNDEPKKPHLRMECMLFLGNFAPQMGEEEDDDDE